MDMITYGSGTKEDPWVLKTPPQSSDYTAWHDVEAGQLVCMVGTTKLAYEWRCIQDLSEMLKVRGDWVLLGNADEGKPVVEGSVEAWARDDGNPVGGYYGTRKGYRGRFANYVPPVMELLGLAEVEHNARGNRMRAL
jgi:hypothetical protein